MELQLGYWNKKLPQSQSQVSVVQIKDSGEFFVFFFFFPKEYSDYELSTALVWKTIREKINISFSYGFKMCLAENTGSLDAHRISGLREADLFIPNSTEFMSVNGSCLACKHWSCFWGGFSLRCSSEVVWDDHIKTGTV